MNGTSFASLDRVWDALGQIESWPVPHAAAAVVLGVGSTVARGDCSLVSRVASVSKPLFSYAVLIAVEEGTLSLDDPAGPPGSTVRHLLSHASGLPFLATDPHNAAPETRRIYSNVGFDILADLLQMRSSMTPADYLREAVFEPLRMEHSELRGSVAKDVWSNVEDLAKFAQELLRPRLVAGETFRAFTSVQFPGLDGTLPGFRGYGPCPWGLGVEIRGHKAPHWTGRQNSSTTFGHFGGSGSFLWVDPDVDAALMCLTGREFGPWAGPLWESLADSVLTALRDSQPVGPPDNNAELGRLGATP